jgi:hypothetical protein
MKLVNWLLAVRGVVVRGANFMMIQHLALN